MTGVVAFLIGFLVLLIAVSQYYLAPAADAARSATRPAQEYLGAQAALVTALLLIVLLVGLLVVVRPSRFFRPRDVQPRTRTKYVDAWAEAGRRARGQDAEEE
jgi:hypothetical protein